MARFRPVLVGLLQALCVAGLVWLVWPKTIPMKASTAGVKAAALRRAPARAIPTGPVWLAGDVLRDGRPVASRVLLAGPASAETVADESGSFRFELGPTFQWLAARAAEEGVAAAALEPGDVTTVTVCANAGAHVACASPRIVLGEEPARLRLELAVGGLLSGTVVDERDRPRAGAVVEARGSGQTLEARTAPDGRFVVSAPPGRYQVHALAPHTLRDLGTSVSVEPNATREVRLRLWSAAYLSGLVVDPQGARVRWKALSVRSGQRSTGQAVQPSKGRFEVDGLVPGRYRIEVESDGFVVQEFDATAPADDLRLTLQPGLTVVGTVFDVDGLPHPGARVAALPEERMTRVLGETHTDEYGSFRIDGIEPGVPYYVVAISEPGPGESSVCAAERVIVFEKTSGLNLRFEPGRTIRGQVVDSRGRPVPNAWLEAYPEGIAIVQSPISTYRATFARADEQGRFSLGHLRFDRYRVSAQQPGYSRRGDSQALVPTGDAKVRLVLSEEGSIRGRVLLPDGRPATEYRLNGQPVRSPDGSFSYPVQRGSAVDLSFEAQGFAQHTRRVQAGRETQVALGDVVLEPPRTVDGVVTDSATGQPISGASIDLAAAGLPDDEDARMQARAGAQVRTDGQGRFSLADAPGLATLVVRHDGFLSAAVAMTPEAGSYPVSLRPGVVVTGRVVPNRGLAALTKAKVALKSGPRIRAGEVAPDGTFSIAGVWPGPWQVQLWEPEREFEVLPRTVEVPPQGLSGLVVSMRDGGAQVTVTGLWDQWSFLVPGEAALPRDYAGYLELWRQGIWGEQGLDGALFRSVEPGAYTLFVGLEESQGRELGYYTMAVEVRGLAPQTFQAKAPQTVTVLPIPPEAR